VLIGTPVLLWTLATRCVMPVWRKLPWFRGALLIAAIAGPWYVGAELRTPGFLDYFLVGEHWHRFVMPGWTGDLYGNAHQYPKGTIWLFALVDWLPWSLLLPLTILFLRKESRANHDADKGRRRWSLYLLYWGLVPYLFFTFAGNILWAYVLPGMPALALWIAAVLTRYPERQVGKVLIAGMLITAVSYTGLLVGLHFSKQVERKSDKALVNAYYAQRKDAQRLLIFSNDRLYSAYFYSNGQVEQVASADQLAERLKAGPAIVAVESEFQKDFSNYFRAAFKLVGQYGEFALFVPISMEMTKEK